MSKAVRRKSGMMVWALVVMAAVVLTAAGCAKFELNVDVSPAEGGAVSPSGAMKHNGKTPVTVTATPAEGYKFANWTVTPAGQARFDDANSAVASVILSPSPDITITANFERLLTLSVSPNTEAGGSVSPTSQSNIEKGTTVNITATENSGYEFFGWVVAEGEAQIADEDSASTTVTLSSNAAVTANFHTTVAYNKLRKRGGIYYLAATNAPYTGIVSHAHCDECGGPFETYRMKNGKLHGKYEMFDHGDHVIGYFKDGKKDGKWESASEDYGGDGSPSVKIEHYKDGKKVR